MEFSFCKEEEIDMRYSGIKSFSAEMEDFKNPHFDHAGEVANEAAGKVKKIEIILQAMWELMQENGVTTEQLHAKIDELVLDPEKKVKPAYENIRIIKCPKCGKSIQESKTTPMVGSCMFCGEKVVFYPYCDETSEGSAEPADQEKQIPSWDGPM